MQKISAIYTKRIYIALLLFIAFALRPAIEVSALSYYQLNLDYIVAEYCVNKKRPSLQCNGKCYLAKQLNLNTTTNTTTPIAEAFIPLFFKEYPIEIEHAIYVLETVAEHWYAPQIAMTTFIGVIDHPPELSITFSC